MRRKPTRLWPWVVDLKESLRLYQELDDKLGIASVLEELARFATAHEQLEWAARLFGAAERQRKVIGVPIIPVERRTYKQRVAVVRDALGPNAFKAARSEGQAMTIEQAIAYAQE